MGNEVFEREGTYAAARDPERVAALRATGLFETSAERRFDRITELARHIFGVRNAQVTLLDDATQFIKSHAGPSDLGGGRSPLSDAICTVTIQEDRTFVVEDASLDERFEHMAPVVGDPAIRFYAGHPLAASSGLLLGALCIFDDKPRSLTEPDARLLKELAALAETEIAAQQDYVNAVEVQRALLPATTPRLDGYRLVGDCMPARGIGGDFFDWRATDDGVQVVLADVMGKGIAAAIVAASVRAVMLATSDSVALSEAMRIASTAVRRDLDSVGVFVTMFSLRLDTLSGIVTWIDSGHGLAFITGADGRVDRLASDELPMGLSDGDFREHTTQLEPGDRLVIVSDGVLDLHDGSLIALEKVAEELRTFEDPEDAIAHVLAQAAKVDYVDDVSLVILERDR